MNRWQFRLFQDSRLRLRGKITLRALCLDYTANFSNIANCTVGISRFCIYTYIYRAQKERNNFHFRSNILYILNSLKILNLWLSSLYKKILIQIYIYIHIKLRILNKRSQRREKKEEKRNWEFLRLLDRFVYHLIIKYNFNKHSITAESCSRDPIFSHLDGGEGWKYFRNEEKWKRGGKRKTPFDRKISQEI